MAAIASVSSSPDPYTNALLGSYKWASTSLSYSFPAAASQYGSSYGSNEPLNNFEALNTTQQNVARAAFANFATVANVTFTELTGSNAANATLRLAMSDASKTAWAYMPHTAAEGGDAWFNNSRGYYDNPRLGNYAFTTFLHEIGHSLGLEHPHENGMPIDRDSMEYSVMSYRSYVGASTTAGYTNESWGYAQSLMMYDIAAMQHMYGANFASNSGNTTYSWSPTTGAMSINGVGQGAAGSNKIFQTVWDGGGSDTYDFSNYTTDLSIDLRPGAWTTTSTAQLARLHYNGSQIADGNIANALQYNGDVRSLIENAIGGSGNDTIVGNVAANELRGNGGNDRLVGDGGFDTAVFGFRLRDSMVMLERGHVSVSNGAERDTVSTVERFQFVDITVDQWDSAPLVDDLFYFTQNKDVLAAGISPEDHYSRWGWGEGRNPNQYFDTLGYLRVYNDVAAAAVDPLWHYEIWGWREGRDPSGVFDNDMYLEAYVDVAASGMNPLEHYLRYGVFEGRSIFSDGLIA